MLLINEEGSSGGNEREWIDNREKVENTREYPYCCIGIVTTKFSQWTSNGTGCLIAPRIVLTCAHNIYSRDSNEEAMEVKFSPAANGK